MKNSKVIITLACTVVTLLAIIGGLVYFLVINSNNSKPAENNTTNNATTDNSNNKVEARDLTEKELKEFEEYFNNTENNGFLVNTYENPKEVDLNEVLYVNSIGKQLTKEEKDYMNKNHIDVMYTDCTRYEKNDINKLLNEKLGISLNDVTTDFTYLYVEEYDSYYNMHGDTNYLYAECKSGKINEDGLYIIDYEMNNTERTVTMKKDNDKYQFVSNINNTQVKVEEEVGEIMLRSNLATKKVGDYTMYYENDNLYCAVQEGSEYGRVLYYKNNKCFAVSITEENENTIIQPIDNSTGVGDEEYLLFVESM